MKRRTSVKWRLNVKFQHVIYRSAVLKGHDLSRAAKTPNKYLGFSP